MNQKTLRRAALALALCAGCGTPGDLKANDQAGKKNDTSKPGFLSRMGNKANAHKLATGTMCAVTPAAFAATVVTGKNEGFTFKESALTFIGLDSKVELGSRTPEALARVKAVRNKGLIAVAAAAGITGVAEAKAALSNRNKGKGDAGKGKDAGKGDAPAAPVVAPTAPVADASKADASKKVAAPTAPAADVSKATATAKPAATKPAATKPAATKPAATKPAAKTS